MKEAELKQVICMKWGTLYSAEYVNRLYAMVRKQVSGPLHFVCLTDDKKGIRSEVECLECPVLPIASRANRPWRKVTLFRNSKHLHGLNGNWLFLDLDVVIADSLDPFFEYKPEKKFIVMQNWTQPGKGIGNTSVYRFKVGADEYLYDNLIANYSNIFKKYPNSQTYISKTIEEINFWPEDWCVLFKVQCVPSWPLRFWKDPILPKKAKVVAFPGDPNPHDAVVGRWPVKRFYSKLYKYIKPARWIQRIWDEAEINLK